MASSSGVNGVKLKKVRKEKGLTQKELAKISNIGEATLRNIELGIANPKLETIRKIANALDVDFFELVDDPDVFIGLQPPVVAGGLELHRQMEEFKRKYGFSPSSSIEDTKTVLDDYDKKMIVAFNRLNNDGKEQAINFVEDIAFNPKYRKGNNEHEET